MPLGSPGTRRDGAVPLIRVAEESGLIVPLGDWALDQACRQLSMWQKSVPTAANLQVHVNVSGAQLLQNDFVDRVLDTVDRAEVRRDLVSLEVTESMLIDGLSIALPNLRRCRDAGLQISIDDFGTGYSSFSSMFDLPIGEIKIDRSFVTRMTRGSEGEEVVRAIIAMGRAMGKSIVAEGVETELQSRKLLELGCDGGQGYLFARPLTPVGRGSAAAAIAATRRRRLGHRPRACGDCRATDDELLHFRRALIDPQRAHLRYRRSTTNPLHATRAVELHRRVDHLLRAFGGRQLGHRRFRRGRARCMTSRSHAARNEGARLHRWSRPSHPASLGNRGRSPSMPPAMDARLQSAPFSASARRANPSAAAATDVRKMSSVRIASLNRRPGRRCIRVGGTLAAIERQSRERMRRHHVQGRSATARPAFAQARGKHEMPACLPLPTSRANTQ